MNIRYLYTVIFALLLLGCSSHEELPPPDNPFDPGNPDYVDPEAEIIIGPTEGEIVDSTSVSIVWEGNESATEYRFKFDSMSWSNWDEIYSIQLDYLDEGNHSFELQARSVNGNEQTNPALLNFDVDAVSGPSVIIYPYLQSGCPGDTLFYSIMAEEVSDLFAVEFEARINEEYLELIDIQDGDILSEWGGEPLQINESSDNVVRISMVTSGSMTPVFTGSTSLSVLVFRVKDSASSIDLATAVEVSATEYLSSDLLPIAINVHRIGMFSCD